jgi:hypothetical protein
MNRNRFMWFSKKDIIAVVAISLLVIIYFVRDETRNWIATAIFLSVTSWLFWKFEQYRAHRSAEK